jgi:NAD(P)-dependent dehydrogenase (short-subunit alcohol dehydrogenase family)
VLSVTVTGTYCYKYAAQEMIAQGDGGRIVGASSMIGKKGKFIRYHCHRFIDDMPPSGCDLLSAYSASKFAVLTQSAGVVICSLMVFFLST